jgi:hypothetical protein
METEVAIRTETQESFLSAIERLASNPNVDVDKIQRIMDMQEHILDRNAKQAFNSAMVRAQSKMPVIGKKKKNTQTGSMYAGYEDILEKCQPIYTKEGLSVTFYQGKGTPEDPLAEGCLRAMADIMHEEGHTKTIHADIPVETTGPKGGTLMTKTHATGSAFSYARSYLIRLIFNIPTGDDDDGNRAGGTVQFITDKQVSIICDMLNFKNISSARLLKVLGAASVETILAKDFQKAKASIDATPAKETN